MEYAIRHPERVSHLMNAGPASYDDYMLFRQNRSVNASDDIAQLQALAATEGHEQRVPEQPRAARAPGPELRTNFTPADILIARAIEHRLMEETWSLRVYNLLPALERLRVSTLVIYGDCVLIPMLREPHRAGDPWRAPCRAAPLRALRVSQASRRGSQGNRQLHC